MTGVVGLELFDIAGTALGVADGVEHQGQVLQPQVGHKGPPYLNDLGVHDRVAVTQGLHAELVVLAVTPRLGTVVAEDGAEVVQAHRLGQAVHTMLQVGAAHRGGALGPQGQGVASTVKEGVGLLVHDVGPLTHRPGEQVRALEGRGINPLESVPPTQIGGLPLNVPPVLLLLGLNILGAAGCPEHCA